MGTPPLRPGPPQGARAVCSQCGEMAETPPLEWVLDVDTRHGRQWICTRCARTHLRGIEAKLEPEWW